MKSQSIQTQIITLFQKLKPAEQQKLLTDLEKEMTVIEPKNLKNLLQERGISKGMYGNVEGFLNNEENARTRKESAFKDKSMSEAVKALRARRKK